MHNQEEKGNKNIMWMMAICCGLPIVLILLFSAGGKAWGTPSWVIFGAIAVMVVFHFFMMKKPNQHSLDEHAGHDIIKDAEVKNDNKNDKTDSGHGCCH